MRALVKVCPVLDTNLLPAAPPSVKLIVEATVELANARHNALISENFFIVFEMLILGEVWGYGLAGAPWVRMLLLLEPRLMTTAPPLGIVVLTGIGAKFSSTMLPPTTE